MSPLPRRARPERAPPPLDSPDWYRIKYQLAALSLDQATEPEEGEPTPAHRQRLQQTAVDETADLARVTAAAAAQFKHKSDRMLVDLLHSTIEPSAFILLAGALQLDAGLIPRSRSLPSGLSEDIGPAVIDDSLTRHEADRLMVERLLFSPGRPEPLALIAFVKGEPELAPQVLYDLACFYARAGQQDPTRLPEAVQWLEEAVRTTPIAERPAIFKMIDADPALAPLRERGALLSPVEKLRPAPAASST